MNYDPYEPVSIPSLEEMQIILAWIFFFWLLIPYHALVGLIKIIIGGLKNEK